LQRLIISFVVQHRTSVEVAAIIQRFLDGTGASWEWDNFMSFPLRDPALEDVRKRCIELPEIHPPDLKGWYCNEEGLKILRELVRQLSREA
jgi:hypothetical protein